MSKKRCKAHHWVLEPPDGRSKVSGTCKKCGVTRRQKFLVGYTDLSPAKPGDFFNRTIGIYARRRPVQDPTFTEENKP